MKRTTPAKIHQTIKERPSDGPLIYTTTEIRSIEMIPYSEMGPCLLLQTFPTHLAVRSKILWISGIGKTQPNEGKGIQVLKLVYPHQFNLVWRLLLPFVIILIRSPVDDGYPASLL